MRCVINGFTLASSIYCGRFAARALASSFSVIELWNVWFSKMILPSTSPAVSTPSSAAAELLDYFMTVIDSTSAPAVVPPPAASIPALPSRLLPGAPWILSVLMLRPTDRACNSGMLCG